MEGYNTSKTDILLSQAKLVAKKIRQEKKRKEKNMQVKNEFDLVDFQNRVKHLDDIYRQDVHEYVNNATLDEHTELANKVEDSGNELFMSWKCRSCKMS